MKRVSEKIAIIVSIISIVTILGTMYINLLNYFYNLGYYNFFCIDIKYINITGDNIFSNYIIQFIKLVLLILAPIPIYNFFRRTWTNKKIEKEVEELQVKKNTKDALKEYYYINKDSTLALIDFTLALFANGTLVLIDNILRDKEFLSIDCMQLICNIMIQGMVLFLLYVLQVGKFEIERIPLERKQKVCLVEECLHDEVKVKIDDLKELDKFTEREIKDAKNRLTIIQCMIIFLFFIILNFVLSYRTGYQNALSQKEYMIDTASNEDVILIVSNEMGIKLNAEIDDEKKILVINALNQERVPIDNITYYIETFDSVDVITEN